MPIFTKVEDIEANKYFMSSNQMAKIFSALYDYCNKKKLVK